MTKYLTATALAALLALSACNPPPPKGISCRPLHPEADLADVHTLPAGIDYEGSSTGIWRLPTGAIWGYSAQEDSIIYATRAQMARCVKYLDPMV